MNQFKKSMLAMAVGCALAACGVAQAAQPQYVIEISIDGLGGTYLKSLFEQTGNTYPIPNLTRIKTQGAGTLYAHCDNNTYETLPNHTGIVTSRPRDGADGHAWSSNSDPAVGQTIHTNKSLVSGIPGSYVASVFDVAHDNGLRTAMYATKSKFSLFTTSYNATYGAEDNVGVNYGKNKIDVGGTYSGSASMMTAYMGQMNANPIKFSFLHFAEPDAAGHGSGWGSAGYNNAVVAIDGYLGQIFAKIDDPSSPLHDKTAIILTADHGNQDNPPSPIDRYAVPFYVWGGDAIAGADLYTLNSAIRQAAASYPMTTYAGKQPIRNADASNLALDLLGLGPIPGSVFNSNQAMAVPEPASIGLIGIVAIFGLRRVRRS